MKPTVTSLLASGWFSPTTTLPSSLTASGYEPGPPPASSARDAGEGLDPADAVPLPHRRRHLVGVGRQSGVWPTMIVPLLVTAVAR